MTVDLRNLDLCNSALHSLKGMVTDELYRETDEYINKYNEWGIGIESLIAGIADLKIRISTAQAGQLYQAIAALGLVDSAGMVCLREHCANTATNINIPTDTNASPK